MWRAQLHIRAPPLNLPLSKVMNCGYAKVNQRIHPTELYHPSISVPSSGQSNNCQQCSDLKSKLYLFQFYQARGIAGRILVCLLLGTPPGSGPGPGLVFAAFWRERTRVRKGGAPLSVSQRQCPLLGHQNSKYSATRKHFVKNIFWKYRRTYI